MMAAMSKAKTSTTGGCLCGAIRFVAAGKPLWVAHCHCQSCRRSTGAPFAAFVGFPHDRVTFTAGTPATYASSPGVLRSYCGDCGTPIAYAADRFPGEIHLYICTLDDPAAITPRGHVHAGEQLAWLHLNDGLPRYRTSSDEGEPMS
jgi:hypothetical protein